MKIILKLELIFIIQGNIEVLCIAYVILNIVGLKKIFMVFHNGSNYDYHFIIKGLADQFKRQCTFLELNSQKYVIFTVSIEKEVTRIDKHGEKLQIIYLTYHNLLIVQDLWQAHYQMLSIIFLKEFIKFIVNMDTMLKT